MAGWSLQIPLLLLTCGHPGPRVLNPRTPSPRVTANLVHPRIAPDLVARRDYQVAIAHESLQRNTLVILPTGMGKTVVALLVIADRLERQPGKVLMLAPTKPLVEQHAKFFREALAGTSVEAFTGETSPEEREYLWRTTDMVISTPQVVQNDVVSGRIDLKSVSLLIFDEAHRAVGNYAYVFIADAYRRQRLEGRVLAMTASPGAKAEKVRDICQNLGIEGVEVRTEFDPDTKPYVQDTAIEWKEVAVPESIRRISTLLREVQDEKVQVVRMAGAIPPYARFVNRKTLLDAGRVLQARVRQGENDGLVYKALSCQAAALKVGHALELAETQGVAALSSYLEKLAQDESKAAKALLEDPRVIEAQRLVAESRVEHPKLRQVAILLRQQLKEKADSRIIVFTNFRDTSETLVQQLAQLDDVRPARFVGQASRSETDRGLSQKKQVEMIERFKEGEFNVLVATSVAEEGLDIPQVDLVIFYEPVPSEVRAIQRRGRTGRKRAGRVVILITKDTRDEATHWASRNKEKKMRREVQALRQFFSKVNASEENDEWRRAFPTLSRGPDAEIRSAVEKPLEAFETQSDPSDAQGVVIVADHREFSGAAVRELSKLGVVVKPETLEAGDYVLSDRVAVERKEAADFASSLIDGRLFAQARVLRDSYSAALMVIEGEGLLTARRISDEAIYSAIAALATDFRIGIVTTRDAAETARLLAAIARREQHEQKRPLAVRSEKGAMSDDERLRYIVEGFPNVGAVQAKRLLDHFGTVHALANAKVEDLMEVDGVGRVTAEAIHTILRTQYVGRPQR